MENNELKKIRELLEFLVKGKIFESLKKLNSDEKKIYELTGEKRDIIQQKTKFSAGKISKIWIDLESKGLIIKEGKGYRRIF